MEVTKQWLTAKLKAQPNHTIGRALAALYRRQTEDEKQAHDTVHRNGVGFASCDARIGTIGAKAFMEKGAVPKWVEKFWMHPNKSGLPKITKYANQLNEIAKENNARNSGGEAGIQAQ